MRLYDNIASNPPEQFIAEKEFTVSLPSKLMRSIVTLLGLAVFLYFAWWYGKDMYPHLRFVFWTLGIIVFIAGFIMIIFEKIHFAFTSSGVIITAGIIPKTVYFPWSEFQNYYQGTSMIVLYLKDSQGKYQQETNKHLSRFESTQANVRPHVPHFVLDTGKETEEWGFYFMSHVQKFR
jgi:hypothetical protein